MSNVAIKRNAEDLYSLLNPIAKVLKRIESNNCKLAECVAIFKDLSNTLKEKDAFLRNARSKSIFESRFSCTITPAHYAAVLISPEMEFSSTIVIAGKRIWHRFY